MIIRARVVVTMDEAPIENGAVATKGNQIIDVGRFDKVKARNADQVLDLGEMVLLPGLINAHCHLDYTSLRGKIPPPKSFTTWIRRINAEKAKLSAEDYLSSIREGFTEAHRFGTTTIANLTAFPELIAQIQPPLRTWWFAELIDVRAPESAEQIVDFAVDTLERAATLGGGIGLAPHAPYTASPNLYRRCAQIARRKSLLLTTHLAESREEMSMFRHGKGPLQHFMKDIGRPMDDCDGVTPLERLSKHIEIEGWIVAHLNELGQSDFDSLERLTTKFPVVHSPRSHDYFEHSAFPFQKLRALGFNICLGTDSLASNDDLSLFAEMRAFWQNEPGISAAEILSMVTLNAALTLGKPHLLGRLRTSYWADMIAVPFSDSPKNVFEQILHFEGPISFSMIAGEVPAEQSTV